MQQRNKLFYVGMGLGFALAFAILWFAMPHIQAAADRYAEQGATEQQGAPRHLGRTELDEFLTAVRAEDFNAMRRLGEQTFTAGAVWPQNAAELKEYAINSTPPYRVYALYTHNTDDKTQRVLLTMNDMDQVVSFMAEEMAVF